MVVVPSRPLPAGIPHRLSDVRRQFELATRGLVCKDVFHSHKDSCVSAWLDMAWACSRGSVRFFLPFYIFHLLWHGKKTLSLDPEFFKQCGVYYARSILFGTTMGTSFLVISCIITRMLGGYRYWATVFIPGTLAGLSILIDHPYRRRIVLNTFYNMALEYLYIRAQLAKLITSTPAKETAIFMATNAVLLYLLRTARSRSVFWFFIPERFNESTVPNRSPGRCPMQHSGSCWHRAVKDSAKYFLLAGALHAIRALLKAGGRQLVKQPYVFFKLFLTRTSAAGFFSIGGYVFLYKMAMCWLARARGKDCALHSVAAGLLSGSAYRLQPNVTLLTSAIISTIALLSDRSPYLKPPPEWKIPEILFALCNGMLLHARFIDMGHCPQFIIQLIDTATRNRSDKIYRVYTQLVSELPAANIGSI